MTMGGVWGGKDLVEFVRLSELPEILLANILQLVAAELPRVELSLLDRLPKKPPVQQPRDVVVEIARSRNNHVTRRHDEEDAAIVDGGATARPLVCPRTLACIRVPHVSLEPARPLALLQQQRALASRTARARSTRASATTRNQPGATQTQQARARCCIARQDRRHEQVRVRVRVCDGSKDGSPGR